ncbi:hypothetical protein JCGZ_00356 [Jatropha curcas]|uniref:Uncharacterized protein n=1 Tax=Jatropha curcas TaxID=180498 RepID=A0A067JH20_JATCU|nr:hypothetical protein JCGZ_00356 [Jatropha curcas]
MVPDRGGHIMVPGIGASGSESVRSKSKSIRTETGDFRFGSGSSIVGTETDGYTTGRNRMEQLVLRPVGKPIETVGFETVKEPKPKIFGSVPVSNFLEPEPPVLEPWPPLVSELLSPFNLVICNFRMIFE